MAFKGNVESFSLADVFQNLAMNSQTGTLRISPTKVPESEEKYVYFQDGAVRFLSGSTRAPLLPPEIFFARGLVSKAEFDQALLQQAETNEQLTNVLMNMQLVNEQQLQDLLVHQISEEIYDLFGWEAAAFEFNEGPPPEGLFAAEAAGVGWAISIPVSHLIMEAARRVDEWERMRKAIPSPKEIFVVDLTVRKAIERGAMETDPVERRVAMLIDGARDVDDIVEDSKLFKFEVYTAISGFLQSSIIRPATLNELNFSEGECARLELPRRRIKVLERILALGGENLRIRRELADLMAKMGQGPSACIHYNILAAAELKEGREEGALEIYKRILVLAPQNVMTREALAKLYAKRGAKRDAYTQYSELFENLRDQHQLREAREAAVHALEADPTSVKMRNALVELLLMEDMHEEASVHLEQLGDVAARSRNTALAADAYRRAMQYRANVRPLKKKLNEVLLTKEDKQARRRRLVISMLLFAGMVAALCVLGWVENENRKKFEAAESVTNTALTQVEKLHAAGNEKDLQDALQVISTAMTKIAEARKLWSPVMTYNSKVEDMNKLLIKQIDLTKVKLASKENTDKDKRSETRYDAILSKDGKNYEKALELLDKLSKDPSAPPDERAKDERSAQEIRAILEEYNKDLAKIAQLKKEPEKAFNNDARKELIFVRDFRAKYSKMTKFPEDLKLPIMVKTDLEDVQVWLDGNIVRTIGKYSSEAERTFRYPLYPYTIPAAHTFKFTKNGYTEKEESTTQHQAPETVSIAIDLKRKYKARKNFQNTRFEGAAVAQNGRIYAGTADGSLVEINVSIDEPEITARYDLTQQLGGGVNREIFGQIFIHKAGERGDMFLYCTKAGYCVGLVKNGAKFETAWNTPVTKIPDMPANGLQFPPTYFVQNGRPMVVLMTNKKAVRIDGENGSVLPHAPALAMPVSANNIAPTVTSPACFVPSEGGMVLVGASDSNLYALHLDGITPQRKWETGQAGKGVFVQIAPFIVDEQIVAAGNDGTIMPFRMNGTKLKEKYAENGAPSAPPLVQGFKIYLPCVGSEQREGLTMVDLGAGDAAGPRNRADKGIALTPATLDRYKRVYYVNNQSIIRCVDASDINKEYWSFSIDHATRCPPIVDGTRVYVLTTDGFIFSFDEPN